MRTNQFRAIMLVLLMAVICLGTMNAQTITVTGIVTDAADGTSITGCSVVNNRSKSGAITDVNGRYSIQAQKGDVLLFRFIGYKEEKRVVKSAKLDVKMKTDDVALEECVVVGYGTMKTKAMSGAYVAVCPTAMYDMDTRMNTEEYDRIQENGFKSVADTPLSTFSIDVDPASYSNMRRFINRGELPPADAIRTEEVGLNASKIAAYPGVRKALFELQRRSAVAPGLVADGRDMGSVVFPEARLKIFLTASAESRAKRRYNQLKEKGISSNIDDLVSDLKDRDRRDMERSVAPLKPAEGARILDSSGLTLQETIDLVLAWYRESKA